MWNIFKKELIGFFTSATGYIILAIFLLGTALFLWIFPGEYNVISSGYANLDGLFTLAPWIYLFLSPAVTMKLFAEERQTGTIELLLTRPISNLKIALGKFLAGWTLMIIALIPTLFWLFTIHMLAEPAGNVDTGAFWGSFIGLILLSGLYTAIGTFASAITKNQLTSFAVAAILAFAIFYGFELVGSLFNNAELANSIANFGFNAHYKAMSRGVIDSRDILYVALLATLFIHFTQQQLRNLRS